MAVRGRCYVANEEPYIYESPDGGKTVFRRRSRTMDKEIRTDQGNWYVVSDLKEVSDRLDLEMRLRRRYPAVQAAWEEYQLLVKMAQSGTLDEEGLDEQA